MTDTAVTFNENTPEEVAYKLFQSIAMAEKKSVKGMSTMSYSLPDKEWILQTYAECLYTVKNPNLRAEK